MSGMNLKIDNDRLSRLIGRFGQTAMEARQLARRLGHLLPDRFFELKREHTRGNKVAHAERLALTDPRYVEHIDEFTDIQAQARHARVQYETHMMLMEARRSLRPLRRARIPELPGRH